MTSAANPKHTRTGRRFPALAFNIAGIVRRRSALAHI
jgi:hypothetical protein